MRFKYLFPSNDIDSIKKEYRRLSKTLHPDVGGDEEEFKILANEYTFLISSNLLLDMEQLTASTQKVVEIAIETITELYPRTRVHIWYSVVDLEIGFEGKVKFDRMLTIEQLVHSIAPDWSTSVTWYSPYRKTPVHFKTREKVTWIDCEIGTPADEGDVIYSGRRYTITRGRKYEVCQDKTKGHTYVMRRSAKLNLKGLLGLD